MRWNPFTWFSGAKAVAQKEIAALGADAKATADELKAEAQKGERFFVSVEKKALDQVKSIETAIAAAIAELEASIPALEADIEAVKAKYATELQGKNSALTKAQGALAKLKALVTPPAPQASPAAPVAQPVPVAAEPVPGQPAA